MKITRYLPILIFAFLFSCGTKKTEQANLYPAYIPKYTTAPTVTDTVRIDKRVQVTTKGVSAYDSTQERQIVQPGANLEVGNSFASWFASPDIPAASPEQYSTFVVDRSTVEKDTFPVGIISLNGKIGEFEVKLSGSIKWTKAPVIVPGPVDTTAGGSDPPVVVDPVEPSPDFVIGCNTFPYTPVKLYKDIGMKAVRVYGPWHWFSSPSPKGVALYSQPMKQAWTPQCSGIKDYLTQCKAAGIRALFCFNQCPEWLRPTGNGTGGNDYPPIPEGRDRLNPESYKEYSEFIFQVVATYGKTKHAASEMRVDQTQQYPNQPINQIETGLGLMEEIELGNELDHWFEGFDNPKYMTPEEHAAMLSKCYDAAHRADPNIRVVMAGLTDFNPWYLKRMNEWFVKNRPDKKFAADVINVHHYSNFKNKPGTLKPDWNQDGACYPEEDGNFAAINEVVALAKSWGKIVYVTEFGADTKQPSQMYAAPRPGMTSEDVQAEIIVRTFKAYKAAGVKAAYVFTGPDGSSGSNTGQFSRSGIFTAKPEYKKKAAYEAIRKLIIEMK